MTRRWAAVALVLAACRSSAPDVADYIPDGAAVIAGARLDALRASPLYGRLPRSLVEPYRDASTLWAVYRGTDLLLIAQGHFREALPGSTMVGRELMISGAPTRQAGKPGSPELFAKAAAASEGNAIWAAARGNVNLPLSGDAANLNRFLQLADYATLGVRLDAPARLDFLARCPTAETAQHLEESLRAFLSLAAFGASRRPPLAALLKSADVRRDDREVRASLTAPPDALPQLFDWLAR